MNAKPTALVLGVTGGIGSATACALLRHGWNVVAMARDAGKRALLPPDDPRAGMSWVKGDAADPDAVRRAAEGAQAIIHAVNPPGYRDWDRLVLPMIDSSITAARTTGARIVLPGTIYNYGPDAFPDLVEDAPQNPLTAKGRIRVELERRLEAAGVPVLIVRFGDFFGGKEGNNWFRQGLVTPGTRLAAITDPGRKGVGHAWAYLPDAAETIGQLLGRADTLDRFARFHFAGHWDADGGTMIRAIAAALGRPDMPVKRLPWPLLGLAGLVQQMPRELHRMRYIWRTPIRLDNRRLVSVLGSEPHTPLAEAVKTTLDALEVR
ncbi:nucleoside-diphosphate-sugar epimerase [Sphingomonas zeicaulis]|uniref:NAD(P)H-binding protein n=1 Tax=Sphingomonas zeicaulis TaxID=1632740 RepID=UPI003D20D147